MAERVTTIRMDRKMELLIDDLQERIGAASRSEVYRRALVLLDEASEAEEAGARLYVRKGKTEKQIILR